MPGLNGPIAERKQLLRLENELKLLRWAKKHQNWATEMWENILRYLLSSVHKTFAKILLSGSIFDSE